MTMNQDKKIEYRGGLSSSKFFGFELFRFDIAMSVLVVLIVLSGCSNSNEIESTISDPTERNAPKTLAEIVKSSRDFVVRVETVTGLGISTGSGFMLQSYPGIIVTANHVVNDATSISVRIGGNGVSPRVSAVLIAANPDTDLALLLVPQFENGLPLANRVTEPGETVLAMGYPLGLAGDVSVTQGIISRQVDSEGVDYLQHDAEILQGNSGGPLLNLFGEVVGINIGVITDVETVSGLYFAIHRNELALLIKSIGLIRGAKFTLPRTTSTPAPSPTGTPAPSPTPSPTLTATPIPTSTPSTTVPVALPTGTATSTPTPSPTPSPTPTATPIPTSTPAPKPQVELPYTFTGSGEVNTKTFLVPSSPFELRIRTATGLADHMTVSVMDPETGGHVDLVFNGGAEPTFQTTLIYGHTGLVFLTIKGPGNEGWEVVVSPAS